MEELAAILGAIVLFSCAAVFGWEVVKAVPDHLTNKAPMHHTHR
jgi:hypothetical protein